jgi:hypothetical protein
LFSSLSSTLCKATLSNWLDRPIIANTLRSSSALMPLIDKSYYVKSAHRCG